MIDKITYKSIINGIETNNKIGKSISESIIKIYLIELFFHFKSLNFIENSGRGATSKKESSKINIIKNPGLLSKLFIIDSFC